MSEVQLKKHQVEWAQRAQEILSQYFGYIDTSVMGSGKTYIVAWLAQRMGFRLLVICPAIAIDIWRHVSKIYSLTVLDILNYEKLRGQKGCTLKNSWLLNVEQDFCASSDYLQALSEGSVLVVFDEMHKLKNSSSRQYRACSALIKPLVEQGGTNRYALLSGTPLDKPEHCTSLMRLLRYITQPHLYDYNHFNGKVTLSGLQELITVCMNINAKKTLEITSSAKDHNYIKLHSDRMVYQLYTEVLINAIAGSTDREDNEHLLDVKNAFYRINEDSRSTLQNLISSLAKTVNYNRDKQVVRFTTQTMNDINSILRRIEETKLVDLARVVRQQLETNLSSKAIMAVNYLQSVNVLESLFANYEPVILTGKIPHPKRAPLISRFNQNNKARVMIMTTAVGGSSISLHDTIGDAPRYLYVIPNYHFLNIVQVGGRIDRTERKSPAYIRYVYAKDCEDELPILKAINSKSLTLKGTIANYEKQKIVLPDQFENYVEI